MFSSLYIHVPFCAGKCDYCAFYSESSGTLADMALYTARLQEDFRQTAPLTSIFMGGGTPSVLPLREWEKIFSAVHASFTLAPGCEWTAEANPDSLTPELLALWAENGVNRLSLGIQSFDQEVRNTIGRRGSLRNLDSITETAHALIPRLNLDLIYNIPGQSPEIWRDTLKKALDYAPEHVSTYALTLEEGTRLAAHLEQQDDGDFIEFWDAAEQILGDAGLKRYEISNFAIPGKECAHNLEIWRGGTYLGCGPAAASFDGKDRWTQPASLEKWLNHQHPEMDILPPESRAAEILAFGMRLTDGWNWKDFEKRTGFNPMELRGNQFQALERRKLVSINEEGARPTRLGLLFNDDIAMALI